jgi:hypothetical protein
MCVTGPYFQILVTALYNLNQELQFVHRENSSDIYVFNYLGSLCNLSNIIVFRPHICLCLTEDISIRNYPNKTAHPNTNYPNITAHPNTNYPNKTAHPNTNYPNKTAHIKHRLIQQNCTPEHKLPQKKLHTQTQVTRKSVAC